MSAKIGRPKIDNPKTERIYIRATPQEKSEIYQFAKENGYTLLELLKAGIEAMK